MNVLHVADGIDPSLGGGTAERTYQLAMALHRAGVSCTVLCTEQGLTDKRRAELSSVRLVVVPLLSHRFLLPKISGQRIDELVAGADVVHVTGHWSVLGARVCLAAQRLNKPYVYCPAGSLRIFGRSAWVKRLYNRVVGRRIVSGATRCLTVTELEREQFHEYGVPDERIVRLPNGVHLGSTATPDPQAFRARYGLEGKQLLLFLGRLNPIKGPDLLLEAFASIAGSYPQARLVFAGPEEGLAVTLKADVAAAGLQQRALFVGYLAGQAKQDALAAADLLVVPSRQEAMSLVALEAGLRGTPVMLTDQCGFDEVQDAGGGLVVAARADAIAAGLEQLLGAAEQLPLYGEKLRQLVLAHYTWDVLVRQAGHLYEELSGVPFPPSTDKQK
ncbi:glycosyltransferase [Pseudomonas sp. WS 5011]|uniref:glycosyltransferase n=1 Tax=Pseudomonas sp. WS 5011 TaxID=2717477 RepID=UPI0014744ECF|nr:glycosyltransferase [Pseudomonas sp. WS 5011]NMY52312.1 glycosyltransferase [Pseudomonas sp. WS 5011]